MLDFIKLGRLLDHRGMGAEARKVALSIATRWDVVQGQRKPGQDKDDPELYVQDPVDGEWRVWSHDLRDTRPRLYRTAPDPETGRQGRVAGRLLPDDLVSGSPSSAVPILFAFVSFVALLFFWASEVSKNSGAGETISIVALPAIALGIVLAFVSNATSSAGKSWTLIALIATLLPMIGPSLIKSMASPSTSIIGAGAVVGLTLLFGGLRSARTTVGVLVCVLVVLVLSAHVPDFIQPAILLMPACALPWGWSFFLRRARGVELAVYGTTCNWEDGVNGLGHVDTRRAQTYRAAKD